MTRVTSAQIYRLFCKCGSLTQVEYEDAYDLEALSYELINDVTYGGWVCDEHIRTRLLQEIKIRALGIDIPMITLRRC